MQFIVLGTSTCTYCKQAIQLLATEGKSFIYLDAHQSEQQEMVAKLKAEGNNTVPQIWLEKEHIGGFTELKKKLKVA